jgi:hypothetical protein
MNEKVTGHLFFYGSGNEVKTSGAAQGYKCFAKAGDFKTDLFLTVSFHEAVHN